MIIDDMKTVRFRSNNLPHITWEVLYNEKGRIMLKRERRFVATKMCDDGSIEAHDYKVRFQPSELSMYSFKVVEMQRRRTHKKYTQERKRYMKAI